MIKRPSFLFALLACGTAMLHAAQLYDITLTNAEKYTQCRISYRGSATTRFTGTDKGGKLVTKEVRTSSILAMREVEAKQAEEEPTKPSEPSGQQEPAETTPAKEAQEQGASEPAPDAGKEESSTPPATVEDRQTAAVGEKAKDASLRLRDKLAEAEKAFSELKKPSRSLTSRFNSSKSRIESNLKKVDLISQEVTNLQEQYNTNNKADFTFDIVLPDQRDQYIQEGQAAYRAMVIDMNEKKGARKIGGLDKFEIMRDRYQGLPEYKEAHEWYVSTLKALESKWSSMIAKEEKRRNSLQPAKREAMENSDDKEYDNLEKQLEAQGLNMAQTWYNPKPRNLKMLKTALNKAKDALRRNENAQQNAAAIGSVPPLLDQFWKSMDQARKLMVSGDLDGADSELKNDSAYRKIITLRNDYFPDEFKEPLRTQRQQLEQEIKRRTNERRNLQRTLERQLSSLERSADSIEAQINALLEDIAMAKDMEIEEETVEIAKDDDAEGNKKEANKESPEKKPDKKKDK